jgi:pimeloyl-ACP methyl ester carboxylesterase
MTTLLLVATLLAQEELPGIKTRFWELKDAGKARAIVLVHGLSAHPFNESKANEALAPSWQSSESTICTMLAEHGSVFAFSYSQNRKVQDLASTLLPHVEKLKTDGFSEIVLVGFSAGGILVRTFVEDHPKAGVTKVVQVCPPNGGSGLGKLERAVRGDQEIFVRSLRTEEREACVRERAEKGLRIPDGVEFVVVVGSVAGSGDGVLSRSSQWPQELRDQGIPAVKVETAHGLAMRTEACSKTLCRLIVTPQPRWTQEGVQAARKEILD